MYTYNIEGMHKIKAVNAHKHGRRQNNLICKWIC